MFKRKTEGKSHYLMLKQQLDRTAAAYQAEAARSARLTEKNHCLLREISKLKLAPKDSCLVKTQNPGDRRVMCERCHLLCHKSEEGQPCRRCGHESFSIHPTATSYVPHDFFDVAVNHRGSRSLGSNIRRHTGTITRCPSCRGVQVWKRKACARCKVPVEVYKMKPNKTNAALERTIDSLRREIESLATHPPAEGATLMGRPVADAVEALFVGDELVRAVKDVRTSREYTVELANRFSKLRTPPSPKKVVRLNNLVKVEKLVCPECSELAGVTPQGTYYCTALECGWEGQE